MEARALEGERELNSAERELEALQPDKAEQHLTAANEILSTDEVDKYPDAKQLRERYGTLIGKVPEVREEIRRRELAAAVKAAKEKIDAARAALKDALAQLRKKRPSEGELEAARTALVAVETALAESEKLESQDTAYSKYALGVQKDVPATRKLIETRTLEAGIADRRDDIARAMVQLSDAVSGLRGKDVPPDAFARARSSADEVQSAIGRSDAFIGKDIPFSKHVAAVREKLGKQRRTIDQREHDVSVQRQRSQVELARRSVTDVFSRLSGREVADELFQEAEAAVAALAKVLEEGSALAAKDRSYSTYAAGIRKQIQASSDRIAKRRIEVAVARKQAEIQAARATLGDALQRLRDPSFGGPDVDSAENNVVMVEKSLEGTDTLTAKDARFSRYVVEVRKAIAGARSTIEQRRLALEIAVQRERLDSATVALKHSAGRLNAPEDFSAAEAAIGDLEKAIEEGAKYGAKNAGYSRATTEARKLVVWARNHLRQRREDLLVQERIAQVDTKLDALREALAALDGFAPAEEQFTMATDAAEGLNKALEEGDELEKKVSRYASYATKAQKVYFTSKQRIEKRRTEIAVRERKMLLEDSLTIAKSGVSAAQKPAATTEDVKAAEAALRGAREELVKGVELERKDKGYSKASVAARAQLQRLQEQLEKAAPAIAFREGPVAAFASGAEALVSARGMAPEEQKKIYASAIDLFKECQKQGSSLLGDHPKLAAVPFPVGRSKVKAAKLLSTCGEQVKSADDKLAAINATLAFYEGPARALDKAQAHLAEAEAAADAAAREKSQREALAELETCLETGRMLRHKQPELEKKRFELEGGRTMTLPAAIDLCAKQAKQVRAKLAP